MFTVFPIPRPVESTLVAPDLRARAERLHSIDDFILESRTMSSVPWRPIQSIVVALGGFFLVLGVAALFTTGIVTGWSHPEATVWGFRHTPLLAGIEILLGLSLVGAARSARAARFAAFGFGIVMAIFGAIVLLEPGVFREVLGANRPIGVLYTATGAGAVLLGGLLAILRR